MPLAPSGPVTSYGPMREPAARDIASETTRSELSDAAGTDGLTMPPATLLFHPFTLFKQRIARNSDGVMPYAALNDRHKCA